MLDDPLDRGMALVCPAMINPPPPSKTLPRRTLIVMGSGFQWVFPPHLPRPLALVRRSFELSVSCLKMLLVLLLLSPKLLFF